MFERLKRWWALRQYRMHLPPSLVERYGRQRYYTPAQVLTTIRRNGLSPAYAAHACVMFCSRNAYQEFLATRAELPAAVAPLEHGALAYAWPSYEHVANELSLQSAASDDSWGLVEHAPGDATHSDGFDAGGDGGEGGSTP